VADSVRLALSISGLILIGLLSLWIIVPMLAGSPWVPNAPRRIRRALTLAQAAPGEKVYDLGAGDGRALLIAAREFGAQATGVEIEPLHCAMIWIRAQLTGLGRRVSVRWESFYQTSLANADVVLVYLTAPQVKRLKPYLKEKMKPGARLVSIGADFDGWQPDAVDKEALIFLYRMPPKAGGLASYLAQRAAEGEVNG